MAFAKQKLFEAVSSLVGSSSLQERLTFAAVPLFALNSRAGELPAALAFRLDGLLTALTRNGTEPLSDNRSYVPRDLTDDEARDLANEILSLFVEAVGGLE